MKDEQGTSTRNKATIGRRDFLKLASVAGVSAGSLALAGCAAPAQADKAAPKADTKPVIDNSTPIEPVEAPSSWTAEFDALIIGAGGGGLNAAVGLANEGLKVALVDRNETTGGNTQHASIFCNFGGHRAANENGWATQSFPYDVDKLADGQMNMVNLAGDRDLFRAMLVAGPQCIDWMEEQGAQWDTASPGAYGHIIWKGSWSENNNHVASMLPCVTFFTDLAKQKGVEILTSTEVTNLVVDNDTVVGIKAKKDNEDVYYKGTKAVVLTAGGFALNRDMYKKYLPSAYVGMANHPCPPNDTGDCIRMGLGVGADMSGFNSTRSFDGGIEWEQYTEDSHEMTAHYLYDGATQLVRQPWLAIDKFGRRVPYSRGLSELAAIQMAQPGGRAYVCFDSKYEEYVTGNGFKQAACRIPNEIPDDDPFVDRVPEKFRNWKTGADEAIKAGAIKKCQTIEELEEQLGLNKGLLTSAVEEWNKACAAGVDSLTSSPYDPSWLKPISTPPYYGAKLGGNIFSTKCGLRINTDMQVINTEGNIIKGLYAGFHTAGNPYGENNVAGRSLTATGTFGSCGCSFIGGYMATQGVLKHLND